MADLTRLLPIFRVSLEEIRDRMDADVNAGLSPDDPGFLDTTPGGFYWDLTQGPALEAERLWDSISTEVPAAMFPAFAWGSFLDNWGATIATPRKDEVKATGEVTFTGTNDTVVSAGTVVSQPSNDPDVEELEFLVTETGTVELGTLTLPVEATEAGVASNVAAGTVTELVTAVDGITDVTNALAITGGADVETDERYRDRILQKLSEPSGGGLPADYRALALEDPSVGFVTVEPAWAGPTTVRLIVTDSNNKPVSQAVLDRLKGRIDPPHANTTLAANVSAGADTIQLTDVTGFKTPGLFPEVAEVGGGDVIAYDSISLGPPRLTGIPPTGGFAVEGHLSGAPVIQSGNGAGDAVIGHNVTIITPSPVLIDITATVTTEQGYSLTGSLGTTDVTADVNAAIAEYIQGLVPGADVVEAQVIGVILRVPGVYDVNDVVLTANPIIAPDAGTGNIALTGQQVAEQGTITLL